MLNELNLAVVGHANVGKTSLLRTLIQDSNLGIISNKPGTTRHVEAITFPLSQNKKIIFYDTPGLEDSIALHDYIDRLNRGDTKCDGVDKLNRFLSSPESQHRFEQEAKVIRQLLKSHAAIYVIDVREPILAKYHDELAVLAYGDKPILAILNFTASISPYEDDWKKLLSRIGIHAMVRFDVVFPSIEGEGRLYQSLSLLIEPATSILGLWQENIEHQRKKRDDSAKLIIAEILVDVAAYQQIGKSNIAMVAENMQNIVRDREQKAINDLLLLYQFTASKEELEQLPIIEGRFSSDLFNKEAMKLMGVHLSKGLISGAAIGAGIDLAVGGVTLGSAALIGAAIGGLAQTTRHYGERIKNKLSGRSKITIDDAIICFLSLRLMQLKTILNTRSHANTMPIILTKQNESLWKKGKLPEPLNIARVHPEWSSLTNKKFKKNSLQRQEVLQDVAKSLV